MSFCRCGSKPAKMCAACGRELDVSGPSRGQCSYHPTADIATIRCVHCQKPLCFWHYSLQPTASGEQIVIRQRCFPGCEHHFQTPEWRPGITEARR
jgi:hypothetical protein